MNKEKFKLINPDDNPFKKKMEQLERQIDMMIDLSSKIDEKNGRPSIWEKFFKKSEK